jgi:hypothetical protein
MIFCSQVIVYFQEESNQVLMDGEIPFQTLNALSALDGAAGGVPLATNTAGMVSPPSPPPESPSKAEGVLIERGASLPKPASPLLNLASPLLNPASPLPTQPISSQSSERFLEEESGHEAAIVVATIAGESAAFTAEGRAVSAAAAKGDPVDEAETEAEDHTHAVAENIAEGNLAEEMPHPPVVEQQSGLANEASSDVGSTAEEASADSAERGCKGEEAAAQEGEPCAAEESPSVVLGHEEEGEKPAIPDEGHPTVEEVMATVADE